MIAMVVLLREHWFEPPLANGLHLSTFVQQLLSLIAQNGGIRAADAFQTLCQPGGPFAAVGKGDFVALLRHLGQKEILMQESSGLLLHGTLGEKLVNHYSFYAAFASDEEFRVIAGGRQLGSLPVSQLLLKGQRILFAGKTWLVNEVDEEQKVIFVSRASGGTPPMFNGGGGHVHTRVRQRMKELLAGTEPISFLDKVAERFLIEGRRAYTNLELAEKTVLDVGGSVHLLTWLGDAANQGLASILRWRGFGAVVSQLGVEVQKGDMTGEEIRAVIADTASCEVPDAETLLADAHNLQREKWDWALPDDLLRRTYASLNLDLAEASDWLRSHSAVVRG
jgi:ATP-dependent Lhr-like helicase